MCIISMVVHFSEKDQFAANVQLRLAMPIVRSVWFLLLADLGHGGIFATLVFVFIYSATPLHFSLWKSVVGM